MGEVGRSILLVILYRELTVSSLLKYEVVISELWDSLQMAGQSEAKAQAKPRTLGAAGPRGAAGASWVLECAFAALWPAMCRDFPL